MAQFSLTELAETLQESQGTGVSFAGKSNKWGTEEEAKNIIDAINDCKALQFLDLEGNTLGVDAAKGIAAALEKHPELKHALWKDLFTGRLKSEIPEALKLLGKGMLTAGAKLTILDCSDNALGPNGMVGLVDLIKSPTCYSLQELKLNNCGLGIDGAKMLAKALTECHQASVAAGTPLQLKVFIAGRNRLENPGATALATVFGMIQTLEHVAIPQNGIYHVGMAALSNGFRQNPNMKILNLNDNTIGQKGAMSLADALEYMQKLEQINFGDCLLKTGGAIFIAEAIQDGHTNLEYLNLEANEIGPDGALSIVSAMTNKINLQTLILNTNQFGSECREQMQQILIDCNRFDALGPLDEDVSEDDADDEENDDNLDDEELDDEDTDEYESDNTENGVGGDHDYYDDGDLSIIDKTKSLNSTANASTDNLTNNLNDSSLYFDNEYSRPNTVETFCSTPNPTEIMFNALEDNDKIFSFRNFFKNVAEENYLIYLVFAILKCSAISLQCKDALEVSQALYKDCYDFAVKSNQVSRVNNFFLIQLGLLKHEDKSFTPTYNLNACRSAMKHAIEQKTFPDDVSNMFSFFLERF